MNEIISTNTINLSFKTNKFNEKALEKINEFLPELDQKTRAFDRQNSQTTISLMTLTLLSGQSPYRMLRQILSEVETRKSNLVEAQVMYAETAEEIKQFEEATDSVGIAKYRQKAFSLEMLQNKINGGLKDIAILIDQYNNIKKVNDIKDWDEEAFEREEKKFHVRRGFELMYRNLLQGGRAHTSTIEYLQQYGVHPQVCLTEVSGYLLHTSQRIEKHDLPHGNDLEDFLDSMANKYVKNVDVTAERLFGKSEFMNKDYMNR